MRKDLLLIVVIIAILALMVVPLTQGIIDVLLAVNMSLAVLMLMVAVYLKNPSDFSTFPSVILLGTAFRLALSVGTTRLILAEADAGTIIETFGEFVVSGSIVIGLVIFLIITVVQFLVVTKGAERVAEVAARFALDAMPGKQMSIDAEVRAGNLDAEEGALRRSKLDKDSQFFGAMDGAMKFVKGDAIAGLIIICINLIGGVAVGVTHHGYEFGEAIEIFTLLTVGDGLVAQIPALLMSLCAGVIVTRISNAESKDLGTDIVGELVSDPRVPSIAAIIVILIGLIPGFPKLIFGTLAVALLVAAWSLRKTIARKSSTDEVDTQNTEVESVEDPAVSRRFSLRIGRVLADSIDLQALEDEIRDLFHRLYKARGVKFPRASFEIDENCSDNEVQIELEEVPLWKGTIPTNSIFCPEGLIDDKNRLPPELDTIPLSSAPLNGVWIDESHQGALDELQVKTMPTESLLAFLTFRFYEHNLGSLFSIDLLKELLAELRESEPTTMAVVDAQMEESALHKMFRYLIEDGVPCRPMSLFVSSLYHWIHNMKEPSAIKLAESLRGSMKRQLCSRVAGEYGMLGLIMIDPEIEKIARSGIDTQTGSANSENVGIDFPDDVKEFLLEDIRKLATPNVMGQKQIAIVISSSLRRHFRNFLASNGLHLTVIAPHEISDEVRSVPVKLLKLRKVQKSRNSTVTRKKLRRPLKKRVASGAGQKKAVKV